MNNFTFPSNEKYQLVLLLSDLGFPTSNNLFGQLTIAINLCRFIHKILKNAEVYILTSGTCTETSIYKNVHVIHTADPFLDSLAYKLELEKIIKNNRPTIVTSFMIHRDAAAVYELSKLKKIYSNLRLLIGLYCTASEYFYDELPIQDHLSQQAEDYILTKNTYTATMKKYLTIMSYENLVDKYLINNEYTKRTYLSKEIKKIIPTEKIYIIGTGEDEKLFKPATDKQKKLIRKKYMLDENEFIVCFSTRFTQYKGSDILEEVLNYYNNEGAATPTFLFPLYPNTDTVILSKKILKYSRLLKNNKVKFFLGLYRQKYLFEENWSAFYKKTCLYLTSFMRNLSFQSREYIEKIFLGILDFPYYNLVNLVFRPSIADSQPNTLLESALCNCPTIGTERVGFYHDITALKKYAIKLPENLQVFNRYSNYKTPEYNGSVKLVAKKFISMINSEKSNFEKKANPVNTRKLVIEYGFTLNAMIGRHVKLYKSLFVKKPSPNLTASAPPKDNPDVQS